MESASKRSLENMDSLLKIQVQNITPKFHKHNANDKDKPKESFENKMKRILEKGMTG